MINKFSFLKVLSSTIVVSLVLGNCSTLWMMEDEKVSDKKSSDIITTEKKNEDDCTRYINALKSDVVNKPLSAIDKLSYKIQIGIIENHPAFFAEKSNIWEIANALAGYVACNVNDKLNIALGEMPNYKFDTIVDQVLYNLDHSFPFGYSDVVYNDSYGFEKTKLRKNVTNKLLQIAKDVVDFVCEEDMYGNNNNVIQINNNIIFKKIEQERKIMETKLKKIGGTKRPEHVGKDKIKKFK